jgi:hypothetical protein
MSPSAATPSYSINGVCCTTARVRIPVLSTPDLLLAAFDG